LFKIIRLCSKQPPKIYENVRFYRNNFPKKQNKFIATKKELLIHLNPKNMARQNLISATATDVLVTSVLQKIKTSKTDLSFLINLSTDQRKKFRKMGPKSVEYVNDNLIGAQQFPNSMPQDFPLAEYQKDVVLIKQLFPLLVAAQALTEALNDTILALGSDSMKEADEVYSYLKMAAKSDSNAKAIVEQIGKRFKGQGNFKPKPTVS
jgi:hypothetical protein